MLSLLLAFAFIDQPETTLFDDWAVACDNVKRCEATALQAPIQFGNDPTQLLLTREPGGAFSIAIDPAELVKGPVTLLVDDKQAAVGEIGENYRVSGEPAEVLAKVMMGGTWLELRSGGKIIAKVSLSGFAKTMGFISAEMRDAGKPLPRVPALKAASGVAVSPSKAALRAMAKLASCDLSSVSNDLPVERYKLDAAATLVLIPCGSGAYNYNSAAFILRGGKGTPAAFDTAPDWYEGNDPAILTNASFSTVDGAVLTSSSKGRGLGDCGTSQSWVWDGKNFRMIEARALSECRGSVNWLTVFRAAPEWR